MKKFACVVIFLLLAAVIAGARQTLMRKPLKSASAERIREFGTL